MNTMVIRDCDSIGILDDIYYQSISKLNLDDDEYLRDIFYADYADRVCISGGIPSVEEIVLGVDDVIQSEIDMICRLLGYSGDEYEFIMSRYEVNFAAYLDLKVQEALFDAGLSFISINGELCQPEHKGINILIGGFLK